MPRLTIRREQKKISGRFKKLLIKVDKKKFALKNGEEVTIDIKKGKHKASIYTSLLSRFLGALMGVRAKQVKYKFKVDGDEDLLLVCGMGVTGMYWKEIVPLEGSEVAPTEMSKQSRAGESAVGS